MKPRPALASPDLAGIYVANAFFQSIDPRK